MLGWAELRAAEGGWARREMSNLTAHNYRIKNKAFANDVSVSRDDLENDRYGTYAPLFTELGQTAAAHPNQLVFGLLKNGFATPCYDAQYFFDTDHQVDGAALSNSAGGTGTAWYLLDTAALSRLFSKNGGATNSSGWIGWMTSICLAATNIAGSMGAATWALGCGN